LFNVNIQNFERGEDRVAQTIIEDEGANESRLVLLYDGLLDVCAICWEDLYFVLVILERSPTLIFVSALF
jgi:hypothetical protein